jgi:hypothetical protein
MMVMKSIIYSLTIFLLLLTACGKKSDSLSNDEKIAGTEVKTWKATKETDANGDKDKLTRDEKRESITFSRSGNVKMGDTDSAMEGKWTYAANTLSLQFDGTDHTENFAVLELTDDKMRLKAEDGSELTMKSE